MHLMFPAFVMTVTIALSLSLSGSGSGGCIVAVTSRQQPTAGPRFGARAEQGEQTCSRFTDLAAPGPHQIFSTTDTKYFWSSTLKVILVTFTETDCRGEQLLANYDGAGTKQVFQNFFG